jgi:SAM-dependent methyltransferase
VIIDQPVNTPSAWSERARSIEASHSACGWSESSQKARFAEALSAVRPFRVGEKVLDYGSGTGGFAEWLPMGVGYVGFDTAAGMVARAAREHPGRVFVTWEPTQRFDVTVVLGTFNLPGSKLLTFAALRRLWDRTGRIMVVSLYAGDDENCLRYTERDCDALLGESYRATVTRWRKNDLMVVLER